MNSKIGLAIITCNREDLFHRAVNSIPRVDYNIVINDGEELRMAPDHAKVDIYIHHKKNLGVGKSKNEALRLMLAEGCEHLFISEDDVEVTDQEVCDKYIRASRVTGIKHFNYAYHGPDNKEENGLPKSRLNIKYNGFDLGFHFYLLGAFSYYHKEVIEKVGYLDERFKNYHEHVEHTYRIIKAGYHPPFWWFADLADSQNMIKDQDPFHSNSVIRKNKIFYNLRLRYYTHLFNQKLGCKLEDIPKYSEDEVREILAELKSKYGKVDE
ncbi:MAG: glycosyltransferase family 2 protein [Ignavibacteriaceae bacterium]